MNCRPPTPPWVIRVLMILHHENIVIGSSLGALLFAHENQYPVFFTEAQRPFRFDYFEPDVDLSCLKIPGAAKSLTTFEGEKNIGTPKELLWERLLFLLSMAGAVPLSNLCVTMRYGNKTITCLNEYSKIAEIEFERAYYFGDRGLFGIKRQKKVADPTYICYDWIAFNRGGKHEIDFIETADNFVQQLWFYPSDRIDGATSIKDVCVLSQLTQQQLLSFEYSETMARFKMLHEMESRGMKGPFNGRGPNGNAKHYKFRTAHISRTRRIAEFPKAIESSHISSPLVDENAMLTRLLSAGHIYQL